MGLVHRDLKPSNIFITRRGCIDDVVKLLDFGLVKDIFAGQPRHEAYDGVCGTPQFMSPEQASEFQSVDCRSDIYAVGCVAYFAITGQPPFLGPTNTSILYSHAEAPVVPPSQIVAGIHADYESCLLRCLEKRPVDRFQNVADLRTALQACVNAGKWSPAAAAIWWQTNEQASTIHSDTQRINDAVTAS